MQGDKTMETIEKHIDVNVPVRMAYNQWARFEEFPRFAEGIEEVKRLDDNRLHWRANIRGKRVEWDAKISEQVPDKRIVWYTEGGVVHNGMVAFNPIGPNVTRVTLRIDYKPEGILEDIGDKLGFVSRQVEGDLQRLKEFIEVRGAALGALGSKKE
jgi:uncharacterized membrane protein